MIGVIYTCDPCGVKDVEVQVRNRDSGEEVAAWMEEVKRCLSIDHESRSPHCGAQTMTYAKIPMPVGTQFIGGPVEH